MRAFPGERGERILAVGDRISDGMEQFMKVKTIVSAGLGASSALLMYLFGLDHWLLWGILFFTLNYITYIGSIAAAYRRSSSPTWTWKRPSRPPSWPSCSW
jgi:predicted PurR-regulated permease PerM